MTAAEVRVQRALSAENDPNPKIRFSTIKARALQATGNDSHELIFSSLRLDKYPPVMVDWS